MHTEGIVRALAVDPGFTAAGFDVVPGTVSRSMRDEPAMALE
jgi:hypothetical protein